VAGGGGGRGPWGWGSGLIRGERVLYPGEPCAWGRRGSGTSINICKKNGNPWKLENHRNWRKSIKIEEKLWKSIEMLRINENPWNL
jgi:hypothetical protein